MDIQSSVIILVDWPIQLPFHWRWLKP